MCRYVKFSHELLVYMSYFPTVAMSITIVIIVILCVTLVGIPFAIAICCCLNKIKRGMMHMCAVLFPDHCAGRSMLYQLVQCTCPYN